MSTRRTNPTRRPGRLLRRVALLAAMVGAVSAARAALFAYNDRAAPLAPPGTSPRADG